MHYIHILLQYRQFFGENVARIITGQLLNYAYDGQHSEIENVLGRWFA